MGIPGIPCVKVPPPPWARYINERVGSLAFFVSLTFSNANQSVSRLLRILIETVEVCRRNKIRTLTSQSELSKLLEELFERSVGDLG